MRYFRSFESYETLGTRRVPSRPTQLKKISLACYASDLMQTRITENVI